MQPTTVIDGRLPTEAKQKYMTERVRTLRERESVCFGKYTVCYMLLCDAAYFVMKLYRSCLWHPLTILLLLLMSFP